MNEVELQTDFETLEDGDMIYLYPNNNNPIHFGPRVLATYSDGYFFCEGSDPLDGPDYYLGDVLRYNRGYSEF